MFPRLALADMPHVSRFGVEVFGYGFVGMPITSHAANMPHVVIGQLGEMGLFSHMRRFASEDLPRMLMVGLPCHVFKVIKAVIAWISILVIDFQTFRARANKCGHDNPVRGLANSSKGWMAHAESDVTALEHVAAHDKPGSVSQSALIADGIQAFKGYNVSPLFHSRIVTQKG